MKLFLVGMTIIATLLSGCKKISAGITTTISRTVMDDNWSVPIANARLKIIDEN